MKESELLIDEVGAIQYVLYKYWKKYQWRKYIFYVRQGPQAVQVHFGNTFEKKCYRQG